MSDDDSKPFYMTESTNVRAAAPEDDLLHPAANAGISDPSLTETQYFGICVPEHRIHGVLYCWHHPNLHTVSGGVWVWQGDKPNPVECEMFDWRNFMSDSILASDLRKYEMPCGYGAEVVEPLQRHRVFYDDPGRGNAFELEYEGLAPPVAWADGKHFEQPMRVRGEILMRGERYSVDAYNVRDRSWGKPRPEGHLNMVPYAWLSGVFDEHNSFSCTSADDPEIDPERGRHHSDLLGGTTLMGGWIIVDGETRAVTSCSKRTFREHQFRMVQRIEMTLTDETGASHEIVGERLAASCLSVWPNMRSVVNQMRWSWRGKTGHGDCQEAHSHDYLRALAASG